jgi:hypothetical protein
MTLKHGHKKEENVKIPILLVLWTVFEVGMNAWILVTMLKIGIAK